VMKLYTDKGEQMSWLTWFVAIIVFTILWLVIGCVPIGIVFLIAGAQAAYFTASIWIGFVSSLVIISVIESVRKAVKNARIYGD
jgi:hypothetical protein